jgi:hypothetical protein
MTRRAAPSRPGLHADATPAEVQGAIERADYLATSRWETDGGDLAAGNPSPVADDDRDT